MLCAGASIRDVRNWPPVERRTTVLSFKTRANDHLLRRCTAGHTSTWHRLAMELTARDGEDTGRLYTESRAGQGENVWTRTPSDAKELQVLDDAAAVEAVLAGFNSGFRSFVDFRPGLRIQIWMFGLAWKTSGKV